MRRLALALAFAFLCGVASAADKQGTANVAGTGTAGTANTNVLTVQGIASGTSGAAALAVQGQVGNNVAAAGNPVAAAGLAVAKGSAPATVTVGNAGALITDTERRLLVNNVHPNATNGLASAATASTQVLGLSGASLSYYVTDIAYSCGATALNVTLVSSTTAGNACATSPATIYPAMNLPVNGNYTHPLTTPIKVTANSAVCCKTSGSTAFSCFVSGFIGP